jgi:hypothetical protein
MIVVDARVLIAVWADLMAIGVEIDDTPIDPLLLARLRVKTGGKMPDCCALASLATRHTAVATLDAQLRGHADGDLSPTGVYVAPGRVSPPLEPRSAATGALGPQ